MIADLIQSIGLAEIITAILFVLSLVFGTKWKTVKGKGKEVTELLVTVLDAIDDDKVTPKEEKEIAWRVRALLGKDGDSSS